MYICILGDPNFSVLQAFPAAISAEEADPFLMCDHFGPVRSDGTALVCMYDDVCRIIFKLNMQIRICKLYAVEFSY